MGLSCPSYLRDRLFVAKRKTFGFKADNFGEVGVIAYFADTMPRVSEQTVPLSMELI